MRDEYPPLDPEQGHSWWVLWSILSVLVGAAAAVVVVMVGYVVLHSWLP
jgi:hypothetical protein